MAKTKSKPAAPESSKKTGTGGKVTKSGSKFEQAKATAKAVVAAAKPAIEKAQKTAKPVVDKAQEVAEVAGEKVKGILKNSTAQVIIHCTRTRLIIEYREEKVKEEGIR